MNPPKHLSCRRSHSRGILTAITCAAALLTTGPALQSSPGEARAAAEEGFQRVMRELHLGGLSLRYDDRRKAGISELARTIDEVLKAIPGEELDLPKGFSVKNIIDQSGLSGIHATGSSLMRHASGRTDWRLFSWTPEGQEGLLRLFGGESKVFQSLIHAPADTDLAIELELDLRQISERALALAEQYMPPREAEEFQSMLDAPTMPDQSTLRETLPKMQLRAWLLGRINPEQQVETQDGFPIPAMDLVIVLDEAGWLWEVLRGQIEAVVAQERAPFIRREVDGAIEYAATQQLMPPPFDFQPVLRVEQGGTRILLASGSDYLAEIMAAPNALRAEPGFAIPSTDLPEQGNALVYTSPRLHRFVTDSFTETMLANSSEMESTIVTKLWNSVIKPAQDEGGSLFIWSNSADGMLLASSMSFSYPTIGMPGLTMMGMLFGFTAPFVSQMSAEAGQAVAMNNARQICLALQIYATEHKGEFPDDLATLLEEGILTEDLLQGTLFQGQLVPWLYKPGLTNATAGNTPVIISATPIDGGWIVGFVDGSVQVLDNANPAELDFPAHEHHGHH